MTKPKYIEDLPYDDRSQAALIADIVIDIAKAPIFLRRAHAKIMSQPEAFQGRFEQTLLDLSMYIDELDVWHDELFGEHCQGIEHPDFAAELLGGDDE
jgi:hypothetical protein